MSALAWIDSSGVGLLSNLKAAPGDRFGAWTPDRLPIGPAATGLGTGRIHRFEFRRDDLVTFEIAAIPDSEMELMLRLKYHLMNGGVVAVDSDRPLASTFANSCLAPETAPSIEMTDRQNLEYTFSVMLKALSEGGGEGDFTYPSFVPGLKLWLYGAILTPTKEDGDFVGGWYDDSGEENDPVQATGSKQPRYYGNQANGHPIVRFDGSDDYMKTPAIMTPTGSPGTVLFWVLKRTGSAVARGVMFSFDQAGVTAGQDESVVMERSAATGNVVYYSGIPLGTYDVVGTGTAAAYNIHALEFESTSVVTPYVNGVVGTPFDVYGVVESSGRDALRLGRIENFTGGGDPVWACPMDVAEIIWYEGILSDAQRNGVTQYLATKYAITLP